MGRISRGYAITSLVFGILEVVCGITLVVAAIKLADKTSRLYSVKGNEALATFARIPYWWSGAPFIIPGLLGMITFCTRSTCAACCHLIFNLLCLLAAATCAGIGAVLVASWSIVSNGVCIPIGFNNPLIITDFNTCACVSPAEYIIILRAPCETVSTMNTLFMTMCIAASIGTIVILIACYVNCVSLCNTEQQAAPGMVITSNPPMAMMQTQNVAEAGYAGQYPPGQYTAMPPPSYEPTGNSRAQLIYNEA